MDIQRIYLEVRRACEAFAYVEVHPTGNGDVFVKAAFQTSVGRTYIVAVHLNDYPSRMPQVYVTQPGLIQSVPHRYREGNLCYLHPSMWNPGMHNLTFVLARTAKWLNKYEVWRETGQWPGAQLAH